MKNRMLLLETENENVFICYSGATLKRRPLTRFFKKGNQFFRAISTVPLLFRALRSERRRGINLGVVLYSPASNRWPNDPAARNRRPERENWPPLSAQHRGPVSKIARQVFNQKKKRPLHFFFFVVVVELPHRNVLAILKFFHVEILLLHGNSDASGFHSTARGCCSSGITM